MNDDKTNAHHGVCKYKYYIIAIEEIKKKVKNPVFFIFSDDINWCKQAFANFNVIFVNFNNDNQVYYDLILMKNCKYFIIANSSLSWWGAWLSSYTQKVVIAPSNWYNFEFDSIDLLPNNWTKK